MKNSLYLLALLLCVSCSPLLVPVDFQPELRNTQSYIEIDSVTYSMEFVQSNSDLVTFWLSIENQSRDTVHLDKQRFMSYNSSSYFEPGSEITTTAAMTERDIEFFYEEKVKDAQAAAIATLFLGAVLVAVDVSADIRDSRKESWTSSDENSYQSRKAITDAALFTTDLVHSSARNAKISSREELRYLPSEMFYKSTIAPGQSHSGKLIFRKGELLKYYRVNLSANDLLLHFDFRKAKEREKTLLYTN